MRVKLGSMQPSMLSLQEIKGIPGQKNRKRALRTVSTLQLQSGLEQKGNDAIEDNF